MPFYFTFWLEQKLITRMEEFQFVYLKKAVLTTTLNTIYYIRKLSSMSSDWTSKVKVA